MRRLGFEVALPGYSLPLAATMALVEHWRHDRAAWHLVGYAFEYLTEPLLSGRRAHHLHDGVVHAHCEDPLPAHPHYRDVEVDLLEAADEFGRLYLRGELTCAGLFPLVTTAR